MLPPPQYCFCRSFPRARGDRRWNVIACSFSVLLRAGWLLPWLASLESSHKRVTTLPTPLDCRTELRALIVITTSFCKTRSFKSKSKWKFFAIYVSRYLSLAWGIKGICIPNLRINYAAAGIVSLFFFFFFFFPLLMPLLQRVRV